MLELIISYFLTKFNIITKKPNNPDCHLNHSVSMAPQVGLEPTTLRLTAECSAIELLRNIGNAAATYSPGPSPAKYHRRAEA